MTFRSLLKRFLNSLNQHISLPMKTPPRSMPDLLHFFSAWKIGDRKKMSAAHFPNWHEILFAPISELVSRQFAFMTFLLAPYSLLHTSTLATYRPTHCLQLTTHLPPTHSLLLPTCSLLAAYSALPAHCLLASHLLLWPSCSQGPASPTLLLRVLTTYYLLLTTHYLLLTTYYLLLTICYSLLTTHYSLLTTYYLLLITYYLLLLLTTTYYYLLLTTRSSQGSASSTSTHTGQLLGAVMQERRRPPRCSSTGVHSATTPAPLRYGAIASCCQSPSP